MSDFILTSGMRSVHNPVNAVRIIPSYLFLCYVYTAPKLLTRFTAKPSGQILSFVFNSHRGCLPSEKNVTF